MNRTPETGKFSPTRPLAKNKNEKKKSDLVTFFRDRSFDSRDLKKRTVAKKSKDVSTLNPITISVSTGCLAQPS